MKKTNIVKMKKDGRTYDVPEYRVATRLTRGYKLVEETKNKADKPAGG